MWISRCPGRILIPGWLALVAGCLSPKLHASCNEMRATVPMVVLQETGPWRCVEIPGFLIYSRLADEIFGKFANELLQYNLQLSALSPKAQPFLALSNQIPVVLRVSDKAWAGKPIQVYDDEVWLVYVVELPKIMPDPAAGTPVGAGNTPQIFGLPAAAAPAGPPTPAELLARDGFWRRLAYTQPVTPQWLRHGLERLMSEMRVTPSGLTLGRPTSRPPVPEVSIDEIFTAEYDEEDALRHEALARQSALFLRWTMVIDQRRREALWAFAARTARNNEKISEAAVMEAFDLTYGQIAVELTDPQLQRARLAGGGASAALQLAEVREASDDEVERLIHTINGINERAKIHNADIASVR